MKQKMHHINKIGIKIYEGSKNNLINVQKTMDNTLDFETVPIIENKELKTLNTPIYVWAGVARVKIDIGDKLVFVNLNRGNPNNKNITAHLFTLIDRIYDKNSEIHKFVGWKGQNWENVVFLKDKKIINLNNNDFNRIEKLTDAYYKSSGGFAGWKQKKWYLYGNDAEELIQILQI